ncbi:FIG074102: hypothetical protein [hydrothermal vent metagenome]|uniref:Winged helix-turn-helix domain-containing protein n=2 Tax=hydrothermal vent metagenome TaxID=652676 RepID=A0A3B0VHU5_9ZZZZ
MENISIIQARKLILAKQKLTCGSLSPQEIIEHLGYVQIDTISVIERAHHHVFWSRCAKYKPSDLDRLVKSRKVFEYWSHAASYLPMSEYRYTLPMKQEFKNKQGSWFPRDDKMMTAVLQTIKTDGPLRSKDFDTTKKGNTGWWDWKPAKQALERLFMEGSLEITRREGFQKVYDLPQRVIPTYIDTSMPTDEEFIDFIIKRTLRHHGLATVAEIAYLKNKKMKDKVRLRLKQMCEAGTVTHVCVEGIEAKYYALTKTLNITPKGNTKIHLLSPFDNLVIQRKKLSMLFDYNYQIECYVPAAKRKYGYFSLPIFKGHKAIARVDCKADRKNKLLWVKSLHYEKNINQSVIQEKIEAKLKQFARFNGCSYNSI